MDRSKHTPTPWRYGSPADAIVAGERDSNAPGVMYYGGTLVAESVDHADREFIIRAVNSHEQLVAALNKIASGQNFEAALVAQKALDAAGLHPGV